LLKSKLLVQLIRSLTDRAAIVQWVQT